VPTKLAVTVAEKLGLKTERFEEALHNQDLIIIAKYLIENNHFTIKQTIPGEIKGSHTTQNDKNRETKPLIIKVKPIPTTKNREYSTVYSK
jgi:hypothetical protein